MSFHLFIFQVNEHCQILKIWYWLSITLEIILVASGIIFNFLPRVFINSSYYPVLALLTCLLPLVIIRSLFWSVSKSMVLDLSQKEGTLFPVRGYLGVFEYLSTKPNSLVQILVSWEIVSIP